MVGNKNRKRRIFSLLGLVISIFLFLPIRTQALTSQILQGSSGGVPSIESVITGKAKLGNTNPEDTVIFLIKAFLSILSLIAVIFILYGGFAWMTSSGNQEKATKGQDILKAAVVGLIVIMISWSITLFVISAASGKLELKGTTEDATGAGEGEPLPTSEQPAPPMTY